MEVTNGHEKREQQYQMIADKLRQHPEMSLYKLCRVNQVSYTGFKHWRSKYLADKAQPKDSGGVAIVPENEIPIPVDVDTVIQSYNPGSERVTLTVPVEDVLTKMTPKQIAKFLAGIIRRQK